MAKTQTRLVPVNEHPAVVEAQAQMDALVEERRNMEEARAAAWRIVNGETSATEAERLQARLTFDASDDQSRTFRLREIAAEEALAKAKAAAKEELTAAGVSALRPAVSALASALDAAAVANDRVTEVENELNVQPDLRVSWRELHAATPISASRLAAWRDYARHAGLLD